MARLTCVNELADKIAISFAWPDGRTISYDFQIVDQGPPIMVHSVPMQQSRLCSVTIAQGRINKMYRYNRCKWGKSDCMMTCRVWHNDGSRWLLLRTALSDNQVVWPFVESPWK